MRVRVRTCARAHAYAHVCNACECGTLRSVCTHARKKLRKHPQLSCSAAFFCSPFSSSCLLTAPDVLPRLPMERTVGMLVVSVHKREKEVLGRESACEREKGAERQNCTPEKNSCLCFCHSFSCIELLGFCFVAFIFLWHRKNQQTSKTKTKKGGGTAHSQKEIQTTKQTNYALLESQQRSKINNNQNSTCVVWECAGHRVQRR